MERMNSTTPTENRDHQNHVPPDYLRDESRLIGYAERIFLPRDVEELSTLMKQARREGRLVTVQGARTGVTGGAVPQGGWIINLSRMDRVLGMRKTSDGFRVTAQAGLRLAELNAMIRKQDFRSASWDHEALETLEAFRQAPPHFFPPDPTEQTASIGGMAACNASGARAFLYGPMRGFVEAALIVLADGDRLELRRGREQANGHVFSLRTLGGRELAGLIPGYEMPRVKNAAGYRTASSMDMLDLFLGAEGTLGVVAEIELRLIPAPPFQWGAIVFVSGEKAVLRLVEQARAEDRYGPAPLAAMEFFDRGALALLRATRAENPDLVPTPEWPAETGAALYFEWHGWEEPAMEQRMMRLSERLAALGESEEAAWMATTAREMDRLKAFRHAVPEAVNRLIDVRRRTEPALTKLGTDMAVPDEHLSDTLAMYHADLEKEHFEHVIFGHIGDNHLHVNILPRSSAEYDKGRAIYLRWAERIASLGGTISAEHGVGKIKTALLRVMYGEEGVSEMRAVKRIFDPECRLNRGVLFVPDEPAVP